MESIGDMANDILFGNKKSKGDNAPQAPPIANESPGPDLSKVEVPASVYAGILSESFGIDTSKTEQVISESVEEEPEEEIQEEEVSEPISMLTEDTGKQILTTLNSVLDKLNEMTTAGAMGANFAGPQKDDKRTEKEEKKRGYPETPKERLARRLKKRN